MHRFKGSAEPGVKCGSDHLRAVRDERAVYLDGERVQDVTTHPAYRNAVASAAALYDYQQYESFYAGAHFVTRGHSFRTYDWDAAGEMVRTVMNRTPAPGTSGQA